MRRHIASRKCDRIRSTVSKSLHMNNQKQSTGWVARTAGGAIFLSGCLLLGLAPAGFTQTIWTGQSGDWFQPVNWSDGVPTSSTDAAEINNGGTAQIETGAAAAGNLH